MKFIRKSVVFLSTPYSDTNDICGVLIIYDTMYVNQLWHVEFWDYVIRSIWTLLT
jgi:hypothetical protein